MADKDKKAIEEIIDWVKKNWINGATQKANIVLTDNHSKTLSTEVKR